MPNLNSFCKIIAIVFFSLFQWMLIQAQDHLSKKGLSVAPSVVIHDTTIGPEQVLLQVDAFDFIGENGQVGAITLRIDVDTLLIDFHGIQNVTVSGSWLANYNTQLDEITITYTAPFGQGSDIDGRLLDLYLTYSGGFPANLNFKTACEFSNANLQAIDSVSYTNGLINPLAPVGSVYQDTLLVIPGNPFSMPVLAEGAGYNMVTQMLLRMSYDTTQLNYLGYSHVLLSGATVVRNLDVITISWENIASPLDITDADTLLLLDFQLISDSNSSTTLLPGSMVYNNQVPVASEFNNGLVLALLSVTLYNQPDTAGIASGGGDYLIGDSVFLEAIPETGFSFANWLIADTVVSTDPNYEFVKQRGLDTITANYLPNAYEVSIVVAPSSGGTTAGEGEYVYGDPVFVAAFPSIGYDFICWMNGSDIVSYDLNYHFIMPPADYPLTASFGLSTFSISVEPNNIDYGLVEGGGDFSYGTNISVVATPYAGYTFVAWSEAGQIVSLDSLYTFEVLTNRDLIANFQLLSDCSAPVGLFADAYAETEAILYWIPSGSESEWDLLWGPTGFDTVSAGTLVSNLLETNYLLTGLDAGTGYDFYVRARCITGANSSWSMPATFTTWYLGLDQQSAPRWALFPNPTSDIVHITSDYSSTEIGYYQIINSLGLVKLGGSARQMSDFEVNVSALPVGMYWLRVGDSKHNETISFVKY